MLSYILKYKGIIKFVVLTLLLLLFLYQCDQNNKLKTKLDNVEWVTNREYRNLLADYDSIRFEKNQQDNVISKISAYEWEVNTLTDQNKKILDSYRYILNINEDLRDINSFIMTNLQIKDSILNASSKITYQGQDSIQVEFNDDKDWDTYNWRRFNGQVNLVRVDDLFTVDKSNFNFEQGMSLTASILKINGKDELRISTPHPSVKFTKIENINLVNDKLNPALQKPKNWSIGAGLQYGINLNYDQQISIGIGVYYSPSWLRF